MKRRRGTSHDHVTLLHIDLCKYNDVPFNGVQIVASDFLLQLSLESLLNIKLLFLHTISNLQCTIPQEHGRKAKPTNLEAMH